MAGLWLLHTTADFSWSTFSVHPSTVIGIAALAALYAWRASTGEVDPVPADPRLGTSARQPNPAQRPSTGQILAFAGGLIVLFFTLNGPLHDLSDSYLFSAHMTQHMVLTMVITPLLIAGTPGWMLRPALRSRLVGNVAKRITSAPAAFAIFSITIVVWHLPPFYNFALVHHPAHIVMHLCFLVASTIMWWPVMSPMPELPRLSYPQQMLYLFLTSLPMYAISVLITYSSVVLYPTYAGAPRVWSLSPLQDQRLGGLVMWIPGGFVFIGAISIAFFRWVAELERQDRRAEAVRA